MNAHFPWICVLYSDANSPFKYHFVQFISGNAHFKNSLLKKVPCIQVTNGHFWHFQVPENGTSSARIKKLRPLFHANIPPKWWSRCLFYSFTTFGRVTGKFWILNILSSFLQCEKTSSIFCPHIVQWENTVSKRDIPVVPIDSTNAFTAFTAFCISVEHC